MTLEQMIDNRRTAARSREIVASSYTDYSGNRYRTEILNVSQGGARITTNAYTNVGDRVMLFERNSQREVAVEVRWVKPLPGGVRMLAGVQRLS